MMKMRFSHLGALALAAIAVTACATTPPPPAVLSAPQGPCDTAISLDAAVTIEAPDNPRRPESEAIFFTEGDAEEGLEPTACWVNPDTGSHTPYGVFGLPEVEGTVVVTAAAPLSESLRAVGLDVRTLDTSGNVVRHIDRDDFDFRTEGYAVRLRPREAEAYILVSVDPDLIGEGFERVAMGTSTTTYSTGVYTSSFTSGSDTFSQRQFSYVGQTLVKVQIIE